MINFNNVTFSYGKNQVLKDFNLTINNGDHICFFAPSGFGKSTILRLIMGLEKPKIGSIQKPEKLKISVCFQEDRLLPSKTVYENIELFGGSKNIDSILESLNLTDAKELYPSQLSGGMARRVAIARALNFNGDVFIFDEPFNGIDKENIVKTADLIKKITKDKTFIMVSHKQEEAEILNTKIIYL